MKKFLPLIIFSLLLILIIIGTYKISNQYNNQLINKSLPQLKLRYLYNQNKYFTNSDLKNNQYYLINFFASWCSTCIIEHNLLVEMQKLGLDIIGIAWRDFDDKAKEILEKFTNPYLEVLIDPKNIFGKNLKVNGTPENFLLNKDHIIIWHKKGPITKQDLIIIKGLINS
ncbi:redoxin family protein [Rickettsiales bacterium]|jgi:cytochrome c biogenesis protein CcmG, thiol:disulfide interchange protein DsbE|nr:redoxin family protein [Rickettsiales bacterium]